jgi:sulfatase modifying factor 1
MTRQRRNELEGMRRIGGGQFLMGSNDFYADERPVRHSQVGAFWIDETPVTNRLFADFVDQTGYVTLAEIAPDRQANRSRRMVDP